MLFVVAAVFLGGALQVANGHFHDAAIVLLAIAFACVVAAIVRTRSVAGDERRDNRVVVVIAVGVFLQFGLLLGKPPGVYLPSGFEEYLRFQLGICAAGVLAGLLFWDLKWTRRVVFPLLVLSHFLLGLWILKSSPDPTIDVALFHRGAFASIDNGVNPHTGTIPNLYGSVGFYGEGIVQNDRVLVGHPYPPLSLAMTYVAHKLTGDYRSVLLLAMAIAAMAIAYSRSSRVSFGVAALFLFTPRTFFVLEQGWTDVLAAMFFSVTVFVAIHRPRWLWMAVGLLLASKQYLLGVLPFLFMLWVQPRWATVIREAVKAVALAAALTLPMVLWNPAGFINDVVLFHFRQPFRIDALSFLALLARRTGIVLSSWVGFAALLPAAALGLWRAPRTPAGFAAASALLFFAFVAFNKQAFCNYYYFVIALLATAVAAMEPGRREALGLAGAGLQPPRGSDGPG